MSSNTIRMGWVAERAGKLTSALALGVMGLALHGQASAACMDGQAPGGLPNPSNFVPAVYHPGESGIASFLRTHDEEEEGASIVGLWQFQFQGFNVDWGTQAFHADGTEIMFSGGQNPETGDVCQGVWRKVGPRTYTLNHIAMGWTAPGGSFGMRIHFHVLITLDPNGNSFTGNYRVDVFNETPQDPFDESASAKAVSGTGTVTATRVRPD